MGTTNSLLFGSVVASASPLVVYDALDDAAKVLRLLHIQELRDLQTKINETIVSVQSITANPKTDSRLGRVGR